MAENEAFVLHIVGERALARERDECFTFLPPRRTLTFI
jgi:hypothetical protein